MSLSAIHFQYWTAAICNLQVPCKDRCIVENIILIVMFMLFFRAGSLKLCILPVEYTLLMMR